MHNFAICKAILANVKKLEIVIKLEVCQEVKSQNSIM